MAFIMALWGLKYTDTMTIFLSLLKRLLLALEITPALVWFQAVQSSVNTSFASFKKWMSQ